MSHIKLRNRDQWIRTQLEKLLISDHLANGHSSTVVSCQLLCKFHTFDLEVCTVARQSVDAFLDSKNKQQRIEAFPAIFDLTRSGALATSAELDGNGRYRRPRFCWC